MACLLSHGDRPAVQKETHCNTRVAPGTPGADCESVGWPPVKSQPPSTHNFGPFKDHHILQKDITLTAFHSRIVPWNKWNIVSTPSNISCTPTGGKCRTFCCLAIASNISCAPTDLFFCAFANLYRTCSLNDSTCSLGEPVPHWYVHTFWWRHTVVRQPLPWHQSCHMTLRRCDPVTQHHNAWHHTNTAELLVKTTYYTTVALHQLKPIKSKSIPSLDNMSF